MMQNPKGNTCDEEYLGSDDRLRIFAARPFTFKARYYWNIVSSFCDGSITLRSCWSALRLPYVGLEHKSGRGIVLVCPEAISIMFE